MSIKSSWEEIHKAAIALPPTCFDGYFAEGISDTMARKMRKDWRGFMEVLTRHKDELKFVKLVLKSINSTLDPNDIRAVGHLAETSCRPGIKRLCHAISKRAADALAEFDPPESRWVQ